VSEYVRVLLVLTCARDCVRECRKLLDKTIHGLTRRIVNLFISLERNEKRADVSPEVRTLHLAMIDQLFLPPPFFNCFSSMVPVLPRCGTYVRLRERKC